MRTRGEKMQTQIMAVLQRQDGPLSAYDILEELRQTNPKIAPTTVYRCLSVMTGDGRVHRLESLNAYMACQCADHRQGSIMAICGDCGTVGESIAPDLLSELTIKLKATGFSAQRHVIEVHGTCSACEAGNAGQ